jgi:hypothetical protein
MRGKIQAVTFAEPHHGPKFHNTPGKQQHIIVDVNADPCVPASFAIQFFVM